MGAVEDLNDAYISKDGKLILDFLQAIHAAEKRQAELDAHIFAEEKRMIKVWENSNLETIFHISHSNLSFMISWTWLGLLLLILSD